MQIRLDKYIADQGIGTRSEAKIILKKRRVTVNDTVVTDGSVKVDPDHDLIACDGKFLTYSEFHYYMLNKPAGVITATEDRNDRTVMDLLIDVPNKQHLSPVGRLDKDTVGLLLITDDGDLNHHLLSPRHHVDKTYEVTCAQEFNDSMKHMLEDGVDIGNDEKAGPAIVEMISTNLIHLTIQEGKYHQVKRMLHAVGNEVVHLKRIQMGTLMLDSTLAEGEYRPLSKEEITELRKGLEK